VSPTVRATDPSRAVIAREDVEQAQKVLDAWLPAPGGVAFVPVDFPGAKDYALLRGLITQALADAHALGYEQGVQRGRRQIGNALRDVLETEGC
jgi:hypothetical protein